MSASTALDLVQAQARLAWSQGWFRKLWVSKLLTQVAWLQVPQAQDSTTEPGCGVRASVEGQAVAVGQLHWVQQQARIQSNSSASSSNSSSSSSSTDESDLGVGLSGQSVIYVGLEGRGVVGALGFSDTLRPDSRYVVQQLLSRGIRVVVLSGLVTLAQCVLQLSCIHAVLVICFVYDPVICASR